MNIHSGLRPVCLGRLQMSLVHRLLAGLAAALCAALPIAAMAQQNTWTFNYTGISTQFFTVPAGVSQLYATSTGGSGGQTNNNVARPGGGGIVVAQISVQAGQVLTIWVGGSGNGDGHDTSPDTGGWGYGCGGPRRLAPADGSFNGGGGGGGSAIALGRFPTQAAISAAFRRARNF
jgi:hypothetical protein